MRPAHQFIVISSIPDSLSALPSLAANLHWSWDRQLAEVFDRLDGTRDGRSWRVTGQHPVEVIRIAQVAFAHLAVESADQVSPVAAGCDNMKVLVADLCQFFEHMTADEAGCASNDNRMSHTSVSTNQTTV